MDDIEKVLSWLEGLTWEDWHEYHSDSEVSTIANAAFELLKEYKAIKPIVDDISDQMHNYANEFRE